MKLILDRAAEASRIYHTELQSLKGIALSKEDKNVIAIYAMAEAGNIRVENGLLVIDKLYRSRYKYRLDPLVGHFDGGQGKLKPQKLNKGHMYLNVQIYILKDNKLESIKVGTHRIILSMLYYKEWKALRKTEKGSLVGMHKNNDSLNNSIYNLRWGTQKENAEEAILIEAIRIKDEHSGRKGLRTTVNALGRTVLKDGYSIYE